VKRIVHKKRGLLAPFFYSGFKLPAVNRLPLMSQAGFDTNQENAIPPLISTLAPAIKLAESEAR